MKSTATLAFLTVFIKLATFYSNIPIKLHLKSQKLKNFRGFSE